MDNGIFRLWPQEPKRRGYLKLKNIADNKDFILSLQRAGAKQQAILDALREEKGVKLPIYKLKRMLDKWGVSNHNLTKKCEKDIRQGVEKRKRLGKQAHKVVMSRSGKRLTKEKLDIIMAYSPTYFKGVKSSSRNLVVLSTPTPRDGPSEDMQTGDDHIDYPPSGLLLAFQDLDRLDDMHAENDNDDPVHFREMGVDIGHGFGADDDPGAEDDYTGSHLSFNTSIDDLSAAGVEGGEGRGTIIDFQDNIEPLEHLIEVFVDLGLKSKDTLVASIQENPAPTGESEGSIKELQEMVLSELAGIVQVELEVTEIESANLENDAKGSWVDAEGQSRPVSAVEGAMSDSQDETPLERYARQKRYFFWEQVEDWKNEAIQFVEEVESISEERGVSLLKAADIVSLEWQQTGAEERLPYNIYKRISKEDINDEETKCVSTVEVDGVNRNILSQIIEENFAALERAVRQLPPHHNSRQFFDGWAVHLPFILSKYGSNHLFTAFALGITADTLRDLCSMNDLADTMEASAVCIYNNIGMATHQLALDCFEWSPELEPELAQAYSKVRNNMQTMILRRYGQSHPKALRILLNLVNHLIKSGLQQQGELMVYGIIQTIRAAYPIFLNSQKESLLGCWRTLGKALLALGKFGLAAKLLVEPCSWEGGPDVLFVAYPTRSCSHLLGRAYAEIGEYKKSLATLFSCFNGYRSQLDINHPESFEQIKTITQVMNRRGPVLYFGLDSAFNNLFKPLQMAGYAQGRTYQELYKAMKRGGIDTQEYIDILTIRAAERSRTPDLQEFIYTQSLECWLAHEDIPFQPNNGGFIEDTDYADDLESTLLN
ncbi:hypothetical protein TWF506_011485 [Arthrobotrys conoides]|uniref:Clr5 domain-containing protein n=1 Tax=Arthrobotrys conoides TaxID=74498 RepID=A0AAN8NAM8_9PEZI